LVESGLVTNLDGVTTTSPGAAPRRSTDDTGEVERLAALERLGVLDTPPEASLDRLTRLAARMLRAPVALISLVDGDRQFFKSSVGLAEPWASARQTPLTHSFCAHVAGERRALVVEDAREDPMLCENLAIQDLDVVAYAGVPLVTPEGHVVGSFCAIDSRPRVWTGEDVELLEELADATMTEIELRRAGAEARDAHERLSFLLEVSTTLVASLDYQKTLANIADLAVGGIADWCSVAVIDEQGELARLALRHTDPALAGAAEELRTALPVEPSLVPGLRSALATGRPELLRRPRFEDLWSCPPDGREAELVARMGLESVMVVPMTARGRTLGAITLVASSGRRPFTENDLMLAWDLASRAALAVDNARLHKAQSTVARTLQRSLLPPVLPRIRGLDVAASYHAAGEGVEVGGDFYDLFATGDGTWGVVMGDVCGKGPDAAALTALARWTVRAGSMEHDSPAAVLGLLNDTILAEDTAERFCTLTLGRIGVTPDGARMRHSRGGHPPTLVLRRDGRVETAGTVGSLIGALPDPELVDDHIDLAPGDSLVLVTDGVLEARDDDGRQLGVDGLCAALSGVAGHPASAIVACVDEVALNHRGQRAADDMAVLALVVEG
jgi:GAF domain-containing protein